MTKDKPEFKGAAGQVTCNECPFEIADTTDNTRCRAWWYRNGDNNDLLCPTATDYAEACALAEEGAP